MKPSEAALRKARKLLGKRAAVRINEHAVEPELRDLVNTLYARTVAPRSVLWIRHSYRFAVGRIGAPLPCFEVYGQGDTWDEAFAEARARLEADRVRFGGKVQQEATPA